MTKTTTTTHTGKNAKCIAKITQEYVRLCANMKARRLNAERAEVAAVGALVAMATSSETNQLLREWDAMVEEWDTVLL